MGFDKGEVKGQTRRYSREVPPLQARSGHRDRRKPSGPPGEHDSSYDDVDVALEMSQSEVNVPASGGRKE
jgi:hypothetical protein